MSMLARDIRQKSKEELENLLREKRGRLDEMSFLRHQKKLKDVKEFSRVKKDIARILTVIRI